MEFNLRFLILSLLCLDIINVARGQFHQRPVNRRQVAPGVRRPASVSIAKQNSNSQNVELGNFFDYNSGKTNTKTVSKTDGGIRNGGTTNVAKSNAETQGLNLGGLGISNTVTRTKTNDNGQVSRGVSNNFNVGGLDIGSSFSPSNLNNVGVHKHADGSLGFGLGLLDFDIGHKANPITSNTNTASSGAATATGQRAKANANAATNNQNVGLFDVSSSHSNSKAVGISRRGQSSAAATGQTNTQSQPQSSLFPFFGRKKRDLRIQQYTEYIVRQKVFDSNYMSKKQSSRRSMKQYPLEMIDRTVILTASKNEKINNICSFTRKMPPGNRKSSEISIFPPIPPPGIPLPPPPQRPGIPILPEMPIQHIPHFPFRQPTFPILPSPPPNTNIISHSFQTVDSSRLMPPPFIPLKQHIMITNIYPPLQPLRPPSSRPPLIPRTNVLVPPIPQLSSPPPVPRFPRHPPHNYPPIHTHPEFPIPKDVSFLPNDGCCYSCPSCHYLPSRPSEPLINPLEIPNFNPYAYGGFNGLNLLQNTGLTGILSNGLGIGNNLGNGILGNGLNGILNNVLGLGNNLGNGILGNGLNGILNNGLGLANNLGNGILGNGLNGILNNGLGLANNLGNGILGNGLLGNGLLGNGLQLGNGLLANGLPAIPFQNNLSNAQSSFLNIGNSYSSYSSSASRGSLFTAILELLGLG